jgi:hypothetical protein
VTRLKAGLADLIDDFKQQRDDQRQATISEAADLRTSLRSYRAELASSVEDLKQSLHTQRLDRATKTAETVQTARNSIRSRVRELRTITQNAKAMRFRDGSFSAVAGATGTHPEPQRHAAPPQASRRTQQPYASMKSRLHREASDTGFDQDI